MTSGGLAGALVTVVIAVCSQFGYEMSGDLASALTVIVSTGLGYFVPEPK